jgi:uncharacterized membrane-anchored protein
MGLREATSLLLILGAVVVARADTTPTRATATRPAHGRSDTPPPAAPAERPDPQVPGAADTGGGGDADQAAEAEAREPLPPHIVGPRHVDLGNGTAIDVPDGMVLLERTEAQAVLRKNGDPTEGVVALVFKPGSSWHVFIDYAPSGYIDDSDAGDLDGDELLDSYRQGTVEQNKTRQALGKPELVIDRWSEPPRYERAQHHLVWGIAAHSADHKVVNFFTRILGRNGYLSVDLIDAPERLEASKKEALAILQATRFNPGSAYADHVSSDKSSGIGLRGLVLGGAGVAVASKLGFFAKFLLLFKKLFIVAFAAIGGFFRWLFRRKPRSPAADPLATPDAPDLAVSPVLHAESPPTAAPPTDDGSV